MCVYVCVVGLTRVMGPMFCHKVIIFPTKSEISITSHIFVLCSIFSLRLNVRCDRRKYRSWIICCFHCEQSEGEECSPSRPFTGDSSEPLKRL